MWDIHEDLRREAMKTGKSRDKERVKKLREEFINHPLFPLYRKHIRSDEGRKSYLALVESCDG